MKEEEEETGQFQKGPHTRCSKNTTLVFPLKLNLNLIECITYNFFVIICEIY